MAKPLHRDASPYAKDVQSLIIDKKPKKWESVLLFLGLCSILLPSAAQAIISGLIFLTFLGLCRWRETGRLPSEIHTVLKLLLNALLVVWSVRLALWIVEDIGTSAYSLPQHIRLMGKQGLYGFYIILAFCTYSLMAKGKFKPFNPRYLLFFACSVFLYCLGQRYWGWDWVHGFSASLGEHRFAYGIYRASGWMGHPLTLANNAMLLALVSLAQALWLRKQSADIEARPWMLLSLVSLGILFLSGSRFPLLLCLGIAVLPILFKLNWKHLVFAMASGGAALGTLLFTLDRQTWGRWAELFDPSQPWDQRFDRIVFWKVHVRLFLEHPWVGTGLSSYQARLLDTYAQAGYTSLERKYNAHNIYLQTLAESGLLGAIGLLLFLAILAWIAIRVKKNFNHLGLLFLFLATAVGGFVQNNLHDSEYLCALWMSIGLCLTWLIERGREGDPESREQLENSQS